MSTGLSLPLKIHGIGVRIAYFDERLTPLLEDLWRPFITAEDHAFSDVHINLVGDHWEVAGETGLYGIASDVWQLMFLLRSCIEQQSVHKLERVSLHAAAVTRGKEAILILGPSYSGKTTLALGLIERGWSYLCDDVALLDDHGRILPFPRPIGVRTVAWEWFRTRWPLPEWVTPPTTPFLVPAVLFPRSEVPARPSLIVVPTIDKDQATEMVAMSAAEAVVQCYANASDRSPETIRVLSRISANATCVLARSGKPEALVHGFVAFLEGLSVESAS